MVKQFPWEPATNSDPLLCHEEWPMYNNHSCDSEVPMEPGQS